MAVGGAGTRNTLSVLHVLDPAPAGGLETVVHGLAIGQHARGHRVHVAATVGPDDQDHAFVSPLREAGVPFDLFCLRPRAYAAQRRLHAALIDRLSPDIVHTHGYRPDILLSGIVSRRGIPVVTTVHGSDGMSIATRTYEWIQRRAFRRFDAVVAVSRPLQASLVDAGIPAHRVHCIPNASAGENRRLQKTPARFELGIAAADVPVIGWVGRLIPVKGADVFLRALADVKRFAWQASIIGDGPERSSLEALARQLGVADRVVFHGAVDGAGRLFPAFDMYVLSSRTEGTPMVLFEAMAANIPIVATRVGGVPDVLSADDAYLVPPEDEVALRLAICASLENPEEAAFRAQNAVTRLAEQFDADQWLDRYDLLYHSLINGSIPGRTEVVCT